MHYVSLREVLLIHAAVIRRYGGGDGIRDRGLVESAIARPRASFGDFEAYPDLFSKGAVLLEGLIKNHGFVDGNKRTATATTSVFLRKNGRNFTAEQKALLEFVVEVVENEAPRASARGTFFFARHAAFGDSSHFIEASQRQHPRFATRGIPAKNKYDLERVSAWLKKYSKKNSKKT